MSQDPDRPRRTMTSEVSRRRLLTTFGKAGAAVLPNTLIAGGPASVDARATTYLFLNADEAAFKGCRSAIDSRR